MRLKVEIKSIEALKQRGEKYIKVRFRDTSFKTQIFAQTDHFVFINESHEWQLSRPLKTRDILTVKLINHSRFLADKVIDVCQISLEKLVPSGTHEIEVLLNENKTKIQLSIDYSTNEPLSTEQTFLEIEGTSDKDLLIDEQQSDATEHYSSQEFLPCSTSSLNFVGVEAMNPPPVDVTPETAVNIEEVNCTGHNSEESPIKTPVLVSKLKDNIDVNLGSVKAQTISVCVRIIEGRQLVGLNIDPIVSVEVGDKKKTTAVKESTNSPYYNEYFVFTFREQIAKVFDKIITITCLQSKSLLQQNETIGSFKLDVSTVFQEPEHQFLNKWAPLSDSLSGETKGYLKCDISVVANRQSTQYSRSIKRLEDFYYKKEISTDREITDEEDIESSLLLPEGVSERMLMKLTVKLFRADGLPKCGSGFGVALKKAFTGESKDLLNPYVVVSFAGLTGKTSVCKKTFNPSWNEQISFVEMFPPLFQRIKIQICNSSAGTDEIIATHYIPILKISHIGDDGFLPTFGPSYVNFYGAPRDSSDDDYEDLNDGLQEGVAYRGRVLLAISSEIIESIESENERVTVETVSAIDEKSLGSEEEYMIFATIFDSNMIPSVYSDKQISYELSIGNPDDIDGDNVVTESDKKALKDYKGISTAFKPVKANTNYGKESSYYLAITEAKPSVFVKLKCRDDKRRLFNSNIISSLAYNFEIGILDVEAMAECGHPNTHRRLLGVIEQFIEECWKFHHSVVYDVSLEKKTKLDRERIRFCKDVVDQMSQAAIAMKPGIFKSATEEIVSECYDIIEKLKIMEQDIQSCIPDIIITLMVNGKRAAFVRLNPRDYLFSSKPEKRGKYCASTKPYCLYSPSKSSYYKLRNKINAYIWFGSIKDKKHFAEGLISGYKSDFSVESKDPPTSLVYHEKHQFQFRAHIFQARSLIASDTSGLSDPYAKVYFQNLCLVTQVVEQTLSPTWDELLVSPPVTIFGSRHHLLNTDLNVVVEFYDRDTFGGDEYIGRASAKCSLRFADHPYSVPQLHWVDILRNGQSGGQLLACFELIQFHDSDNAAEYPKALPEPKDMTGNKSVIPIPATIKPSLSQYRLAVIFWGLRDLKKVEMMSIDRPRVDIECGGRVISSNVISNYKKNRNFTKPLKYIDLELPDQEFYFPPIVISVVDCRAFGRTALVGTHIIKSASKFISRHENSVLFQVIHANENEREVYIKRRIFEATLTNATLKMKASLKESVVVNVEKEKIRYEQQEEYDWWTKYYASKIGRRGSESSESSFEQQETARLQRSELPHWQHFAIYSCELENAEKYKSNIRRLHSYDLYKGKRKSNKAKKQSKAGRFKGEINLSKFPLPKLEPFELLPSNEPMRIFVRCYIVRAYDVKPKDVGGKADLYPVIKVGKQKINDRENYIPNELDPIFGRCYEFQATLPLESTLTVSLKDRDMIGSDDLIGSTKIDLEDRFYSYSRSIRGLQKSYETQGVNVWRDPLKPSQILANMCKELKLSAPLITNEYIKIAKVTFKRSSNETVADNDDEQFCLDVLHNWKKAFGYKLVEEHIETRNLYSPERPGLCQGKLEMWVDLFPMDKSIPAAVDITPRKPQQYELRVIIWNTEDVILEDDNFVSNEKMSDIYIKGWLTNAKEAQSTDVHYRSLTGEGNFNWRFVFPFDYIRSEDKIVVHRKASLFSLDTTEMKIPPNFVLQIWDADSFSRDDFLASITFDLNNFPRGAKSAKSCSLDLLKEENNNRKVSLFKMKRVRGWWPASTKSIDGEERLGGKIDAEFHLLTREEAEQCPVGLGRKEPDPLDAPIRPETSFLWFQNPLKSFKHIIWGRNKWRIFRLLLLFLLIFFLITFIYAVPGYTVKRVLGA